MKIRQPLNKVLQHKLYDAVIRRRSLG